MKIKIAIISYYFYPDIHPRAFRAHELAKGFANIQYSVDVYVPDLNQDFTEIENSNINFIKIKPGFYLNKMDRNIRTTETQKKNIKTKKSFIKAFKHWVISTFYFSGFNFEFFFTSFCHLRKCKKQYDLFISISYPMSTHIGTALARLFNNKLAKSFIADYGDPYFYNPNSKLPIFHKWVEKLVLKQFNYVTIPVINAIDCFLPFKTLDKIKIIPQGLNFDDYNLAEYKKNEVPTFIYAGMFYENIREPYELFHFLNSFDGDYKFIIYTNIMDKQNATFLEPIINNNKVTIKNYIERDKCIIELSKADFLVDIQNTNSEQIPSKLIDYYLSKRPIFTYKPGNFKKEKFLFFLNNRFTDDYRKHIDISVFDIKTVISQFIDLVN